MDNFKEDKRRRFFNRSEKAICNFVSKMRLDGFEVELYDLSASGAKFFCPKIKLDKECFVKINVLSGMSEFTFKTKAEIKRTEGENIYAVAFIEMNQTTQVMLDEILNANNRNY